MKTRCPACGATNSLDALIAHDDAREALKRLVQLGGETAALTMRYLGLFRPAKTELTFRRVSSLLDELLPAMQAQRIERNGQIYEAPLAAWHYAMQQAVSARDSGTLKTPLKSHGWLFEVISKYRPDTPVTTIASEPATKGNSKTMGALAAIDGMMR